MQLDTRVPCYAPALISRMMTGICLKHRRKVAHGFCVVTFTRDPGSNLGRRDAIVGFIYRKAESHARGVHNLCYARLSRREMASWRRLLRSSRSIPCWPFTCETCRSLGVEGLPSYGAVLR
jgi:hypothetical protein